MKKNNAIEGARGILILFIVLYHYTSRYPFYSNDSFVWNDGFIMGKHLGNCGFLIVSGYLFFKSMRNISSTTTIIQLIRIICKKTKRLYFPFAVALIFLAFSSCFVDYLNQPKWLDYATNILLLRTFIKIPIVDGAHWYFYAIIQLNILIPLIVVAYKKKSLFYSIIAIVFYSFLIFMKAFAISKLYLLCFLAGGILTMNDKKCFFIYAILSLIVSFFTGTYAVMLVFILLPMIFNKPENYYIDKLLGNRILVFIGSYSYMW